MWRAVRALKDARRAGRLYIRCSPAGPWGVPPSVQLHSIDEVLRLGGVMNVREDRAGLDDHHVLVRVQQADLGHPLQRDEDRGRLAAVGVIYAVFTRA